MQPIAESHAARAAEFTARGLLPAPFALAAVALGAALLFGAADSVCYGDAPDYARQIREGALIAPGHLRWRPLAALLAVPFGGYASDSAALRTLQYLSATSGVLAVLALYALARRLVPSRRHLPERARALVAFLKERSREPTGIEDAARQ